MSHIVVKKEGDSFWEGRVDSGRVAYTIVEKGGYILGGRGKFWEGRPYKFVEKGGIFWEGGVDSGSFAYSC